MDTPVMLSRIAGVVIVIIGLALGWKAGSDCRSCMGDNWWEGIETAVIPVACGVLIMVAAEVLSRLGKSNRRSR